jgi:ParB family chromosome partitioning protein
MSADIIEEVPTDRIRVANPRTRNKVKWQAIVASISAVGLKKPITVSRRQEPDADGNLYDLVCGQGRLEAFRYLGISTIPAIITEASEQDQYLMSLVENVARRPSSNKSLYLEVRSLRDRGYDSSVIARTLGMDRSYTHNIVRLVEHDESNLIEAVEAGRVPISVAVQIAIGEGEDLQKALLAGYETEDIRGPKLQVVRKLIKDRRARQDGKGGPPDKKLTGPALASLYKQRVREQQRLVGKADQARDCLLIIATVIRTLLGDENFATLLRAEALFDMPEQLAIRIG